MTKTILTIAIMLLGFFASVALAPKTTAKGEIWHRGKIVSWWANDAKEIELRINRPDGDLFGRCGPDQEGGPIWGTWEAGDWAQPGVTFYMQDVGDGRTLTSENTITVMEW